MGPRHMITDAWHTMAEVSCAAMVRWADGAWSATLHGPKGAHQNIFKTTKITNFKNSYILSYIDIN